MDWRAKVELFARIRLEYEFGVGTIQGVSRKLRGHRRLLREAIQSAVPARWKKTERPLYQALQESVRARRQFGALRKVLR